MLYNSYKYTLIAILKHISFSPTPQLNTHKDISISSISIYKNLISSKNKNKSSEGKSNNNRNNTNTSPNSNSTNKDLNNLENNS